MPIPAFTIDGVIPPYVGPNGLGGRGEDMTPYMVSAIEVVATLGVNDQRRSILQNWLQHRADIRALGFDRGFQWLDGSFVEDKDPRDLDIITFTYRPAAAKKLQDFRQLCANNPDQLARRRIKAKYNLDAFFVDLNGAPETIVNTSRYYLGLFSHRRGDDLWKGMLQVRMENVQDDAAALAALNPPAIPPPGGAVTP